MNNRHELERRRKNAAPEVQANVNKPPLELADKELLDFDERYKRLFRLHGEAGVWLRIVALPQRVSMFPRLLVTALKQRNRIRWLEEELERRMQRSFELEQDIKKLEAKAQQDELQQAQSATPHNE